MELWPQRTSGLEAMMTRRKQPWGQQRGWIVPADGSPPQELPQQMVGQKLISWSGTMPEKEPAKHIASKDYYHRHVLNPEGVSVYLPEGRDAESLPESIKNEIRRQLKDSRRRRSDPFDLEPPLEEPGLNLPLALKLGHLHELTSKVASRELVHLVILHPVATRPHDLACVRIEEGAIVWVSCKRVTPDDPRRVIRMPEETPIGVSLQPQRLHAPHTGQQGPGRRLTTRAGCLRRRPAADAAPRPAGTVLRRSGPSRRCAAPRRHVGTTQPPGGRDPRRARCRDGRRRSARRQPRWAGPGRAALG